jgi:DNA polymerase I-like protein with 3'-5' exonuclease and polymerase domains
MTCIAFDTETALIQPGLLAPPLACMSWANEQLGSGLWHVKHTEKNFRKLLESDTTLVTLNGAYDMAVSAAEFPALLGPVFEKYGSHAGVVDVGLSQRLIDIARGELGGHTSRNPSTGELVKTRHSYSLSGLHERHGFGALEKELYRRGFGALIDTPLHEWPADARKYAEHDAVATMRVHLAQQEWLEWLADTYAQARAAFALHLMSCRGIRTDAVQCAWLQRECEAEIERCRDLCLKAGLIVTDKKNGFKKATKAAKERMRGVCDELQIEPKKTDSGDVSLDAEACNDSGDSVLMAYATYTSASSLRKKTARMAFGAIGPLQTRYEVLVTTGRTSSSAPMYPLVGDNYQNLRRNAMEDELGHVLPGQRECFIPRPGYVFCSVDLDNAEMRAMAQICIWKVGYSKLADALNSGLDTHLALAASALGISDAEAIRRYKLAEKAIEHERQFMKIPNFSLLGGAGALTMIPYAKKQKPPIIITRDEAWRLYNVFHGRWTEVGEYHAQIKAACGRGMTTFESFVSGRQRGLCWYTAACNQGFQALTGDASKAALLPIQYECYVDKRSDLYGSYPLLYVHDEVIAEVPIDRAHEAGYRLAELMVQPWNENYTPDVPMTAAPALMPRWYKGAKTKHDAKGRLQIWEPEIKLAA